MDRISDWAQALVQILDGNNVICPFCGKSEINADIYSNEERMGFAVLSCPTCKSKKHFSRIAIPQNFPAKKM